MPLGCFSHHPQLALVERIWCICLAVENRKMSLCYKLSYSAQLLHLLNSACVHTKDVVTQILLLKKLHVLGSQCSWSGFLPPEHLNVMLQNMHIQI